MTHRSELPPPAHRWASVPRILLVLCAVAAVALLASACRPKPRRGVDRIEHVIVLMQENRSFDHYFGHLRDLDPDLDVEPEPADASNPDPTTIGGPPIGAFHQTNLCEVHDLNHSWSGTHREWDNGTMDGFTRENIDATDPTGRRAMGYYTEQELPFYYDLFSTFAIGDRYFSSVLSATFPNRFYLTAGTSFGHVDNELPGAPNEFSQRSVFNSLDEAGISWKVYVSDLPFADVFGYVRDHASHVVSIGDYFTDAAAGNLPQVAFIEPRYLGAKNVEGDEHPPANVQIGQRFVADVVNGLFASPNWSSSALFLTYDEHGGFYDHVPPPVAPAPDSIAPLLTPGDDPSQFDRYGIRVPVAVVSPFSKPRFVSHVTHDHASILRFIETRFGLPALTARDAQADPTMLEFFEFRHVRFEQPPSLAEATVDASRAECAG